MFVLDIMLINQIIALITNRDKPIPAIVIAAFDIHFLPFQEFLSSDHEDKTKNPQYNI
jgi:hypothetical protein